MINRVDMFFASLAVLFSVWLVGTLFGALGQRSLFYRSYAEELSDFWMPRMCLEYGYVGHPEKWAGWREVATGNPIPIDDRDVVAGNWYTDGNRTAFVPGRRDKVYPKIALLPLALFPASRLGGYLWTISAGAVFLMALCLVSQSWRPMAFAMSMPFLFNLERGNPIWLSAACVAMFLAWWDDESEWKRMVAAASLAIAGAMKIAPCVLGILYFTKWRWKPVLFSVGLALALMFVPWFFDRDGFAALAAMLRNASEHSIYVLRAADFGLVELWRTARVVLGLDVDNPWPGMMFVARLSQLLGLVSLIIGARRRDYLLVVGGMLLAAGNMYYYAALYLLPVFVIEYLNPNQTIKQSRQSNNVLELLLWLAILCPLQLVLLGHSANQFICNASLLALLALRALFRVPMTRLASNS